MAYTSVIPVRRLDRAVAYVQNREKTTLTTPKSLEDAVAYALDRDKTESHCFETGLACTCETAFEDMKANALRWHKTDGVQGYHLVQSFAEGEVTPELAHQIGVELAEQLLGGRYQAIVTTHLNTRHYHNHIVWSAVALDSGRKYHSNAKTYYTEVRAISDALCEQYGLSIIQTERENQESRPYAEWKSEKAGQPTWCTAIREDVDAAIAKSFTWRQFIRHLESQGYEVRMGRKHPTLRPPGKERFVRFKTLGKRYTPEAIQLRILYPNRRLPAGEHRPPTVWCGRLRGSYPKRKLTGLQALYYRYLYELGALPRKPRRPSYAVRQDVRNLDKRIAQMKFLLDHGIDTMEQLNAHHDSAEKQITELVKQRKQLYRSSPGSPQIGQLTAQLKTLRKEEKLCRQIAAHSIEMQHRFNEARQENQDRQQREQEQTRARKPNQIYNI